MLKAPYPYFGGKSRIAPVIWSHLGSVQNFVEPHFVAGYDVGRNQIAPIIAYMRGWSVAQIADYCRRKGWTCESLK